MIETVELFIPRIPLKDMNFKSRQWIKSSKDILQTLVADLTNHYNSWLN